MPSSRSTIPATGALCGVGADCWTSANARITARADATVFRRPIFATESAVRQASRFFFGSASVRIKTLPRASRWRAGRSRLWEASWTSGAAAAARSPGLGSTTRRKTCMEPISTTRRSTGAVPTFPFPSSAQTGRSRPLSTAPRRLTWSMRFPCSRICLSGISFCGSRSSGESCGPGVLVLTVYGQEVWERLDSEIARQVIRKGILHCSSDKLRGIHPEWYQTTFHTSEYVLREFGRRFEVLAHIPGGMGDLDAVVLGRR